MSNNKKCCVTGCDQSAAYVRSTQFAGDHYFCEKHAKAEPDFQQEKDGQFYWCPVNVLDTRATKIEIIAEKHYGRKDMEELAKHIAELPPETAYWFFHALSGRYASATKRLFKKECYTRGGCAQRASGYASAVARELSAMNSSGDENE